MNIIYITPLWSGVKTFFTEGKIETSGMPAFYEVFIRLLRNDKISKIYVITYTNEKHFVIPDEFVNKIEIIVFPKKNILFNLLRSLNAVRKIKKSCPVSCIYGHGSFGGMAGIAGLIFNIQSIRRIYGTFLINEIESPKLTLFIKHPLEYMTFSLKAKHIFITNDGTQGDRVYQKIGYKKLQPHFLLNGINKNPEFEIFENIKVIKHKKYVSYIARFDRWKRQHLFVEIIHLAALRGIRIPAYIIGQIFDYPYYIEVVEKIKEYGLEDLITIIPGLPKKQINTILQNSVCSFSLYHTSNLGNVFLEGLSLGVPMIAINCNESLRLIDQESYVCLKEDDLNNAVEKLQELWSDSQRCQELSRKALLWSQKNLMTWEERANLEIEAILK